MLYNGSYWREKAMIEAPSAGMLKGKSVLITGGSAGIGKATALLCAANGASITIGDLNSERGLSVVDEILSAGGAAQFVKCDISQEPEVVALINAAVEKYGALHCAFNNAAVPNSGKRLSDLAAEDWLRVHNVDLFGTFLCMKYEILAMLANGGGAIVNTSSAGGMVGFPYGADYVAAKHGVIGLTRAAAIDYGKENIRINVLAPGACRTEMFQKSLSDNADLEDYFKSLHPIGRFAEPNEMAQAAVWLMSDWSSFVHGARLAVDGGYTAV